MKDYMSVMGASSLFEGLAEPEIRNILECVDSRTRSFQKGEYIYRAGDPVSAFGMVLSGSVLVTQEDFWGNRHIVTILEEKECFAESFASAPNTVLNVSVVAQTSCIVLFLSVQRVLEACPCHCTHHQKLVRNLLSILAYKNLELSEKLSHLSQRTTRAKLLSYLSAQAQRQGKNPFEIPFSRQQLADYLLVERSGLSAELGRMQKDGLMVVDKSRFELK